MCLPLGGSGLVVIMRDTVELRLGEQVECEKSIRESWMGRSSW